MAYRKLKLEARTFEYVIGRTFVKVREHGKTLVCAEKRYFGHKVSHTENDYVVSPGSIARSLRSYLDIGVFAEPEEFYSCLHVA